MTPPFPMPVPGQRAAEEFDSVLNGRSTAEVADRFAELVATVQVLDTHPALLPRADFVADLRSRLMTAAETEMVAAPPAVRRTATPARRRRRLGTIAAALIIVGGSAGMAAAAAGAQPGESLYPIKRGVERVNIAAHLSDAGKGAALLDQADRRLEEMQTLISDGSDADLVDATARDFVRSADQGADTLLTAYQSGADTTEVTTVRTFTASAMGRISTLAAEGDVSARPMLRDLADVLADIDQKAAALCAACGDEVLSSPVSLADGAETASVTSLVARPSIQFSLDIKHAAAVAAAAERARINGLKQAAQGTANDLDKSGSSTPGGAVADGPVTSTLTEDGSLVPSTTKPGGGAVKNLVGGLTAVTGGPDATGEGAKDGGLADTVKKAGKKAGDGVADSLDDLTEGLLPAN